MKIDYIQLFNFRQFYGKSPKIFFSSGKKNVTVLHANNGSGKTALLNAFTWTLYDTFTTGFQLEDQLVNKRALRETKIGDSVEAWVEIKFEHNGCSYVVKRVQQALRIDSEPGWQTQPNSRATLQLQKGDGDWRVEENVEKTIGRVLPKDLHNYFFFDGERIERIVQPTQKQREEIKNAAKKLLGIEIVERGVNHLNDARKELEKELKSIGNAHVASKLEEKEEAEESLIRLGKANKELAIEKGRFEEIIAEVESRLHGHQEVKQIQEKREELLRRRSQNQQELLETTRKLKDEISKNGYSFYVKGLIESFQAQIEIMRTKGELPAGIKKQFVEDLLEQENCICGSELKPGTAKFASVEQWKEQAGLADVEEKALSMGGQARSYEVMLNDFTASLDELQQRILTIKAETARIDDELEDIKEKLYNSPKEEISDLEKRRSDCEQKIHGIVLDMGGNEREQVQLRELIEAIDKELSKLRANESKQRIAQDRIQAAKEAHERMKRMLDLFDCAFREQLQVKINHLFSKMTLTPYHPKLGDDYSIQLKEAAGGRPLDVAASQGENQILSLSFIGSIIEVARDHLKQQSLLPGADASSYPVVMDSPFGALDHNYRKQIAQNLPGIADQVVVLASKTQWRGEVEAEMENKVGKSYVLTYYTPRKDLEVNDKVSICGKEFALVKASSNEFEYTEVVEVGSA